MFRFVIAALLAAGAAAADVLPVKLLNTDVHPSAVGMLLPTAVGGNLFFVVQHDDSLPELWVSIGTGSAHPVAALPLGTAYTEMVPFRNGIALLAYRLGYNDGSIWLSDGTTTSSIKVSGYSNQAPRHLTATADSLYLVADQSIWRTDGSQAGTSMVAPQSEATQLKCGDTLLASGGKVFFLTSSVTNCGVSVIDGSNVTTLARFSNGASRLTAVGGRVYFLGDGGGLWTSDGTAAGTRALAAAAHADAISGSDSTFLYFKSQTGLWRTDGTDANTAMIKSGFTAIGGGAGSGKFVFAASGASGGPLQLWATDGTATGTAVLGIPSGFKFPLSNVFVGNGGGVYYLLTQNAQNELFVSDGTSKGVSLGWIAGHDLPDATHLTPFGPGIAFVHNAQVSSDMEILISNGTAAGTQPLPGLPTSSPARVEIMAGVGADLYFAAVGPGSTTRALWKTDGTAPGTVQVSADPIFDASCAGCHLTWETAVGRSLFFSANDTQLWRSDGTGAGTAMLREFNPQFVGPIADLGGNAFFVVNDGTSIALWKTDGTAAGTASFKDLGPAPGFLDPEQLVVWNGALYFAGVDATRAFALWKTDGTPAGTTLLASIAPAGKGGRATGFTPAGAHLFFLADDGVHGRELWKTDGTPAGTAMVADVNPGPRGIVFNSGDEAVGIGNELYFYPHGVSPEVPWKSDGTAAGTVAIQVSASQWSSLRSVGNALLFFAQDAANTRQVWGSNGTTAGTSPLTQLRGNYTVDEPFYDLRPLAAGGLLFFAARDDKTGQEPWVSDGTVAGTRMLADLAPGLRSSLPRHFTQAGSLVYFSADDSVHGRQLYATPVAAGSSGNGGGPTGSAHGGCSSGGAPSLWAACLALLALRRLRTTTD